MCVCELSLSLGREACFFDKLNNCFGREREREREKGLSLFQKMWDLLDSREKVDKSNTEVL